MYYLRNWVKPGSFANLVWANVPRKRRVKVNNNNNNNNNNNDDDDDDNNTFFNFNNLHLSLFIN